MNLNWCRFQNFETNIFFFSCLNGRLLALIVIKCNIAVKNSRENVKIFIDVYVDVFFFYDSKMISGRNMYYYQTNFTPYRIVVQPKMLQKTGLIHRWSRDKIIFDNLIEFYKNYFLSTHKWSISNSLKFDYIQSQIWNKTVLIICYK